MSSTTRYWPRAGLAAVLVTSSSLPSSPAAKPLLVTVPSAAVHVLVQGPPAAPTYTTPKFVRRLSVRLDICSPVTTTASYFDAYSQVWLSTTLPPARTKSVKVSPPPPCRNVMKSAWSCCPAHSTRVHHSSSSVTQVWKSASLNSPFVRFFVCTAGGSGTISEQAETILDCIWSHACWTAVRLLG